MDERIEHIKELQNKSYKHQPQQSTVLGNFYAIITIVTVCISMLYYVQYIQPAQKAKAQRELEIKQHEEFIKERARIIALSHKLNARDYNATK